MLIVAWCLRGDIMIVKEDGDDDNDDNLILMWFSLFLLIIFRQLIWILFDLIGCFW